MEDLSDKDLSFDFGFTIRDADELEEVQELVNADKARDKVAGDKADLLHKAILPLLNNLLANPEKPYILWPDRTAKIEEFKQLLQDIVDS